MEPILARFVCPLLASKRPGTGFFSMSLNGLIEHSEAGFSRAVLVDWTHNQNGADGVWFIGCHHRRWLALSPSQLERFFYDFGHISDR